MRMRLALQRGTSSASSDAHRVRVLRRRPHGEPALVVPLRPARRAAPWSSAGCAGTGRCPRGRGGRRRSAAAPRRRARSRTGGRRWSRASAGAVERSAKCPASGSPVCTSGAPGASASSSVVTAGSSSYSTSTSSSASRRRRLVLGDHGDHRLALVADDARWRGGAVAAGGPEERVAEREVGRGDDGVDARYLARRAQRRRAGGARARTASAADARAPCPAAPCR